MNSNQAKQIPLENILGQLGCKPKQHKGTDIWYHSPFRHEKTASFKLNKRLNTWYDFGLGQGGTVIDFVCEYYGETVKQALERLERSHLHSIPKAQTSLISSQTSVKQTNNQFTIDAIKPLTDTALLDYLSQRKIDLNIAKQYLQQIHFHYGTQTWQQKALGFKNDVGGYEIRNAKFKGFIYPQAHPKPNTNPTETGNQKTITSINIKEGNKLAIFEGFMDFLSYLTYQNITDYQHSAVILNSTSNYQACQQLLTDHNFSKVYFFLDNDDTVADTLKKLTLDAKGQPVSFDWVDKSDAYAGFNDMNDFLCKNIK